MTLTVSAENEKKAMQLLIERMRNTALHAVDSGDSTTFPIEPRAFALLKHLNLCDDPDPRFGEDLDLDILAKPEHPRRLRVPAGPLVFFFSEAKDKITALELSRLFYSPLLHVRQAAFNAFDVSVRENKQNLTPKTQNIIRENAAGLLDDDASKWRVAAVAMADAIKDDIFCSINAVRQALSLNPSPRDLLGEFVPRVLRPATSSLDSIVLAVGNPELQKDKIAGIIANCADSSDSLEKVCDLYYQLLGHLPLAPASALGTVVERWASRTKSNNIWETLWKWADSIAGPMPRYHVCYALAMKPEWIPTDRFQVFWDEVLHIVHVPGKEETAHKWAVAWRLRYELARHYCYHLEARLPESDGGNIANIAWWLAEQVSGIFRNTPETQKYYRETWIAKELDISGFVWQLANPYIKSSALRSATLTQPSLWSVSLLSAIAASPSALRLETMTVDQKGRFYDAIIKTVLGSVPLRDKSNGKETYAFECPILPVAEKWIECQEGEDRNSLEDLVKGAVKLSSREYFQNRLLRINESEKPDQIFVGLALRNLVHSDPSIAETVWSCLSDSAWRDKCFGQLDLGAFGHLAEAILNLQIYQREQWFSALPHYFAEACDKATDPDRKKDLFNYTVQSCLVSDTVSAIERLLKGRNRKDYIEMVSNHREQIESALPLCPGWVAGKLRAVMSSLHVV